MSLCRYSPGPADPVSLCSSKLSFYHGWYVPCATFAALVSFWSVLQNVYITHPASNRVHPSPQENPKNAYRLLYCRSNCRMLTQVYDSAKLVSIAMYIEVVVLNYLQTGPCPLQWRCCDICCQSVFTVYHYHGYHFLLSILQIVCNIQVFAPTWYRQMYLRSYPRPVTIELCSYLWPESYSGTPLLVLLFSSFGNVTYILCFNY